MIYETGIYDFTHVATITENIFLLLDISGCYSTHCQSKMKHQVIKNALSYSGCMFSTEICEKFQGLCSEVYRFLFF